MAARAAWLESRVLRQVPVQVQFPEWNGPQIMLVWVKFFDITGQFNRGIVTRAAGTFVSHSLDGAANGSLPDFPSPDIKETVPFQRQFDHPFPPDNLS